MKNVETGFTDPADPNFNHDDPLGQNFSGKALRLASGLRPNTNAHVP